MTHYDTLPSAKVQADVPQWWFDQMHLQLNSNSQGEWCKTWLEPALSTQTSRVQSAQNVWAKECLYIDSYERDKPMTGVYVYVYRYMAGVASIYIYTYTHTLYINIHIYIYITHTSIPRLYIYIYIYIYIQYPPPGGDPVHLKYFKCHPPTPNFFSAHFNHQRILELVAR